MNIASVMVYALPDRLTEVEDALGQMPGVEVHGRSCDGRLVVVVEEDDRAVMSRTVLGLHHLEGVLTAALVYQYGDGVEE